MKEGRRKDFNRLEELLWGLEEANKKIAAQGQNKEVKHGN